MKKVVFVALPALAFCLVLSVCPVYAAGQQSTGFDQNRPTAPAARTSNGTQQQTTAFGMNSAAPPKEIHLDPAEYNAYNNATGTTDPNMRANALEAFLQKYPDSQVKIPVMEALVAAYQQSQKPQQSVDAANRLLAVDSWNLRALVTVAGLDRFLGVQGNTPNQALLDQAAEAADKGLRAPMPQEMSLADYQKAKKDFAPIFDDAKGVAEENKKDYADAIKDLTQALKDSSDADANAGNGLQDQFMLAQSYVSMNPANTLLGAYYYARVSALLPQSTDILKNAKYYYHKYHGKDDGFDVFQATAKANLFPPATLATTVTPAPSPTDIANGLVTSTPDLTTLALSDREFLLVNASQENADKVWATLQDKTQEIPGVVISATATSVQLAVSDDAQQSKTADMTINMTDPLKTVPTIGSQATFAGTFTSYTKSPFMIILKDGKAVEKKAPVKHTPARRAAH